MNNFNKSKSLPPMAGSFFGYLSYENIYNIENNKIKKLNKLKHLRLFFVPEYLFIFDNYSKSLFITKHIINEAKVNLNYENAKVELDQIELR